MKITKRIHQRYQTPSALYDTLIINAYQEPKWQNFVYTYNCLHNKHRKKDFHNRINLILKQVKFPWFKLEMPINENLLKIRSKDIILDTERFYSVFIFVLTNLT